MLLYPLLTGWAARELEKKIKGARLQSIKVSKPKNAVWLILSANKGKTEGKTESEKTNLFFSFQAGKQLFYLAPVPQAKNRSGWEAFASSKGGEFIKSVRRNGGDSIVEILLTGQEGLKEDEFLLRFTLFGRESRMELLQPPDAEKPKESWPVEVANENRTAEEAFDLAEIEKTLHQHSDKGLEEALRKALRIPGFLAVELSNQMEVQSETPFLKLSDSQKQALREIIRKLLENKNFLPHLVFAKSQLKGISPFELKTVAKENQIAFPGFLEAMSYAAAGLELQQYESKLLTQKERLSGRKEKIRRELKTFENPEQLRQMGDLILAAKAKIKPRSTEVIVENWFENPPLEIKIPLEPAKTPQENAQAYFAKFKKSERALELLPRRISETENEIQKVDALLKQIAARTNAEEKWKLVYKLESLLPLPAVAKKIKAKTKPLIGWTFWTKDCFKFRVGRNSQENDQLTLREANKNDLFLHASQSPGSHVILVAENRPFSKETILEAAAAAAHFSKARHSTKVNVDYTEARYVQKPRKAKPGLVVLLRSKSVMVYPKKPERGE